MAPHSSTLAWKIPWVEEPGRLQSMGSRRVRHDWETSLSLFAFMHWRGKWQPAPVSLPSRGSHRGEHDWCYLAAAACCLHVWFIKFYITSTFLCLTINRHFLFVCFYKVWPSLGWQHCGNYYKNSLSSKSTSKKKSTSARMLTVKNVLLATLIGLVIFLIGISHFFCYQLFILKFLKKWLQYL